MSALELTLPSSARAQGVSSLVGLVAAALLVLHTRYTGQALMPSYLFVWLFLLGLSLGALALIFVHNLTGGDWGAQVRPVLEPLVRMLPYCALLAIPMLVQLPALYSWMRSGDVAPLDVEPSQTWYLNSTFFWTRWVLYFAIWIVFGFLVRNRSSARTWSATTPPGASVHAASAVGLFLYLITATFSSIDWTMSLTPRWVSTEFGLLIGTGQCLSALAFAIVASTWFARIEPGNLSARFHDLGNLLLALVLIWSYLAFMQFIIMWIEDLPHDISWYLPRTREGWGRLTFLLACIHFAVPFLLLLSRAFKRTPKALRWLAALLLLASLTDAFWLVIPAFRPQRFELQWNDLLALLGVGGIWLGLFMRAVRRSAGDATAMPTGDPEVHHA
jgi:hypothetical protein